MAGPRYALDPAHRTSDDTPLRRLARKALRDPYYAALCRRGGGEADLVKAGFFDDGLRLPVDTHPTFAPAWASTPLSKLAARMNGAARPVALLSTGAFSPIHAGHLAMMEAARKAVEARGFDVVGGFLSPSHDGYVSTKVPGPHLPAPHRLQLIQRAVADSDWLSADPWEALDAPAPINFTDVIERLSAYLRHHCRRDVAVAYVYGSDNEGFADAFLERGMAVCVTRPGHPTKLNVTPRVLAAEGGVAAASRDIRKGIGGALPAKVDEAMRGFFATPDVVRYFLRDDGASSTRGWCADAHLAAFRAELTGAIAAAFAQRTWPDRARTAIVDVVPSDGQIAAARAATDGMRSISLDVHVNGDATLAVSRNFALSDGQWRHAGLAARPGCPPLDIQLASIPPGEYALIEDDCATGQTLRTVVGLLPAGVSIAKTAILTRLSAPGADYWDVLDLRDFLVGSRHGGLVVTLPTGGTARAPYLYPYVSLQSRAKLPPSSERAFSRRMWAANAEFFAALPRRLTVADADPGFQELTRWLGFPRDIPLADLCQWHALRLADNQ
jgi:nicotinic acid mononucleotide adenylyltransferase